MAKFEFVGGSHDGQYIEAGGEIPVEMEIRLPSFRGKSKVEVYILRDDGKFHLDHFGHPPLIINPDKPVAQKEDLELVSLLKKLVPDLEALEQHFVRRGGFPPQIGIGKWVLKRKDV